MFYHLLKVSVSIFFNLVNKLLGGKMPPFGSACAIVERDGKYLVVELPGKRIVFPGGFMTWSEHPHQAAEREGREETGLHLRALELINVHSAPTNRLTRMSTVSFVYHAEVIGGELRKSAEGRPHWLSESELRQRMEASSLRLLDAYLRRQAQPATTIESDESTVRPH
jgi:ADP-ribose pyrophosphatase YjhB (NUDIX family)